jgi:beta-glucosidase
LVDAVKEGHIPESKIDILALHVLELAAKVGMDDETRPEGVSNDLNIAKIPSAPVSIMTRKTIGQPGVDCFWCNDSVVGENLIHREVLESTRTLVIEFWIKNLHERHCSRMSFILTPDTTGNHTFGVTACGATTLKVDDKKILSHPGFGDVRVEYIMQPGDFEV